MINTFYKERNLKFSTILMEKKREYTILTYT